MLERLVSFRWDCHLPSVGCILRVLLLCSFRVLCCFGPARPFVPLDAGVGRWAASIYATSWFDVKLFPSFAHWCLLSPLTHSPSSSTSPPVLISASIHSCATCIPFHAIPSRTTPHRAGWTPSSVYAHPPVARVRGPPYPRDTFLSIAILISFPGSRTTSVMYLLLTYAHPSYAVTVHL